MKKSILILSVLALLAGGNVQAQEIEEKEKSGAVCIYEEFLWHPQSSVSIEIAEDDFSSFGCSHICSKKVYKPVEKEIVFADYFNGLDEDTDCFDCPRKYSLKECLEMKKSGKPFIWEEE